MQLSVFAAHGGFLFLVFFPSPICALHEADKLAQREGEGQGEGEGGTHTVTTRARGGESRDVDGEARHRDLMVGNKITMVHQMTMVRSHHQSQDRAQGIWGTRQGMEGIAVRLWVWR